MGQDQGCLSFKLPSRNQQLGQSEHPSLNLPPQGRMKFKPLLIFISLAKIYTDLDWVTCLPQVTCVHRPQAAFTEEEVILKCFEGK